MGWAFTVPSFGGRRTRRSGSSGRPALLALGLAALITSACATTDPVHLPPVTEAPTQLTLPGKFVWVDLVTGDLTAVMQFYGGLFGWEFEDDADYVTIRHGGRPIAGLVLSNAEGEAADRSAWIGTLSVADVDRAAELVVEGGGAVERGPLDALGRGRAALVRDPGGAHLMLLRAKGGDPADEEPRMGDWLWRELWTRDAGEAIAFYRSLARYDERPTDFEGYRYVVLEQAGRPRAGIVEAPMERIDPLWVPYVRVKDAGRAAARAQSLGGKVVLQNEDAAIILDPNGAAFGVQRWSPRPADGGAER